MKLTIFVLCALLFAYSHGWVGTEPKDVLEEHPGSHCFERSHHIGAMEKNEQKQLPGRCGKAKCTDNGDVDYTGCGAVGAVPPCVVVPEDLNKDYPDCCQKVDCNAVL